VAVRSSRSSIAAVRTLRGLEPPTLGLEGGISTHIRHLVSVWGRNRGGGRRFSIYAIWLASNWCKFDV